MARLLNVGRCSGSSLEPPSRYAAGLLRAVRPAWGVGGGWMWWRLDGRLGWRRLDAVAVGWAVGMAAV